MRCRICEIAHKNINKHSMWVEYQVCRACFYLLDIFSLNNNYLKEYWEGINSIKEAIEDAKMKVNN